MKHFGSTELEQSDLSDALQFVLTRNRGWLEIAVEVIVIGGFCLYAWWQGSVIAMIFAALAIVGTLANWVHGRETILRVNEKGILARGNLESWFTSEIKLPIEEITSMAWLAPNEDAGGVVVSCGYRQSYVLPGVTEEQGRAIINAIAEKFPDFPIGDRTPAPMLFGDNSGITTLGLSEFESQSSRSSQ